MTAIDFTRVTKYYLSTTYEWGMCECHISKDKTRIITMSRSRPYQVYRVQEDTYGSQQNVSNTIMDDNVVSTYDEMYGVWYRPPAQDGTTYGSIYILRHSYGYEDPTYGGLYAGSGEYYEVYRGQLTDETCESFTWTKGPQTILDPWSTFSEISTTPFDDQMGSFFYDYVTDRVYFALRSTVDLSNNRKLWYYSMSAGTWHELTDLPGQYSDSTLETGVTFVTGDGVNSLWIGTCDPDDRSLTPEVYKLNLTTLAYTELTGISTSILGYIAGAYGHRKLFVKPCHPTNSINYFGYYDFDNATWYNYTPGSSRGRVVVTAQSPEPIQAMYSSYQLASSLYLYRNDSTGVIQRDAVLAGTSMIDRNAVLDTDWRVQRYSVVSGKYQIERDAVLSGKNEVERYSVVNAIANLKILRRGVLRSADGKEIERPAVIRTKDFIDRLGVYRTKFQLQVGGVVNAGPKIYAVAHFDNYNSISGFTCKPLETEKTQTDTFATFFNSLTVRYNQNMDGKCISSITLQAPGSINYYGDIIHHEITLDLVYKQEIALTLAKEYLLQHCTIPLEISFNYDFSEPSVETMDHVELSYPIGISEDGTFSRLRCRVRSIEQDYYMNMRKYTLLSDDYTYFSPHIRTVQYTDSQLLGGAVIDIEGAQDRTFTITEDSVGNKPIVGAEVTINDVTEVTDSFGQVTFKLASGRYTVVVKSAGHETKSFTVPV